METLRESIIDIFAESFEVPRHLLENPQTPFKDLQLDSLDVVDLLTILEEKTGRSVPVTALLRVRTIGDIYALVENTARDAEV